MKKIISLLLFSALCMCSFAQRNVMENDLKFARKPYHFGIHLAANFGDLKVKHNAAFAMSDSILSIKSKYGIGFEIGAVISYHINKYFEFRTVPSFAFNNNYGDYGVTIILQHQLKTINFYTLYGHLSIKDIAHLRTGQFISRGENFAHFGPPEENGNWPAHLHFQLITDLGNYEGD